MLAIFCQLCFKIAQKNRAFVALGYIDSQTCLTFSQSWTCSVFLKPFKKESILQPGRGGKLKFDHHFALLDGFSQEITKKSVQNGPSLQIL